MFKALQQQWAKRKLRDPRWEVLFQANDEEWVSVDCETTSLNVAEAEILSIGAVKVRGNRILSSESFYRVVKPASTPMPPVSVSTVYGPWMSRKGSAVNRP